MESENLEGKRRRKKEKLGKFKGRAELIAQMIRLMRIGSIDVAV